MHSKKEQKIISDFSAMPWTPWLHRRFSPLVTYLMMLGGTREVFKTQGIDGEFPISLYDTDDWYSTPEMFSLASKEAESFLKQRNIIELTGHCEALLDKSRALINNIVANPSDPASDYEKVVEIITPLNVYVFVAHSSEVYYHTVLRERVKKYVPETEIETFIGDISFPIKKNALALFEDDVRAGVPLPELHAKYAWIKARGGFLPGYTLEEMKQMQDEIFIDVHKTRPEPVIPEELKELVNEVQELVYLRTLRTDALWELYHLAQPIFERASVAFGVASVKDFIPDNLLSGRKQPLPYEYAILKYGDDIVVTDYSIIKKPDGQVQNDVRGVVAYKGVAKGTVKIVRSPKEIEKVLAGDILVTNMTIPTYVSAMRRAAAFVTDEGGITCHAAILAREMKKPCVIGTKIATKIFKDGDIVEVDAEKGIVRKI